MARRTKKELYNMTLSVRLLRPKSITSCLLATIFSLIFLVGCSSENTKLSNKTINLVIEHGNLQGKDTVKVNQDETVTFNVTSDQTGTLHIHGYDLEKHIEANKNTSFTVKVSATGRFIIALHSNIGRSAIEHDHSDDGQHEEGLQSRMDLELGYLEVVPN
jgi:hypothetical protein